VRAIEPADRGTPTRVLAGHGVCGCGCCGSKRLEKEGMEMYVAVRRGDNHGQRTYDYRPLDVLEKAKGRRAEKPPKDPRLVAMQKEVWRQRRGEADLWEAEGRRLSRCSG